MRRKAEKSAVWSLALLLKQLFLYNVLQMAVLTFSPLNWPEAAQTEPGFLHCVHLGSMGRSSIFIFPQQGTCTEAPARTGVGVGTSEDGPPFTCSRKMEGVTCASPETPDSAASFARHSYIQKCFQKQTNPITEPISCTVLFLFSPVGQIPFLLTAGKCPICKM